MSGSPPPLPLRGLHGPARPHQFHGGGGAAGPDRVIVTSPLTSTVRTTSTTQRDVTRDSALPVLRTGRCARKRSVSLPRFLDNRVSLKPPSGRTLPDAVPGSGRRRTTGELLQDLAVGCQHELRF